ncbi:hypothetical protein [Aeromonas sp. 1HA1]|uniref:hypothetical protein n=1 Tax=Aeromonas sp. 1HA1 TaxID=2699193 RepID=UPI0023DD6779|nr:hypothetical protein [Aeromonas sp. 1HA1]MDF2415794.1 hypothetical protein [Aeromonas sp. 1HA1]
MDKNLSQIANVVSVLADNQSNIQDQLNDICKERERVEREKYISEMTTIYSEAWSAAATYTNVIILAGYAGLFGLLSTLKEYIIPLGLVLSGFCIALSLVFFVFHEVLKMAYVGVKYSRVFRDLKDTDDVVSKIKSHAESCNIVTNRLWIFAFVPTVFFGLLGAFSLIYFFYLSLVPLLSQYIS